MDLDDFQRVVSSTLDLEEWRTPNTRLAGLAIRNHGLSANLSNSILIHLRRGDAIPDHRLRMSRAMGEQLTIIAAITSELGLNLEEVVQAQLEHRRPTS